MRLVIQFLLTEKPNESQPIFVKLGLGHITMTCGSNRHIPRGLSHPVFLHPFSFVDHHLNVQAICFQKWKQATPMKFVEEKELIEKTIDRSQLSTSISTVDSDTSNASMKRMVKKSQGRTIIQDTDDVSFRGKNIYWGGGTCRFSTDIGRSVS